MHTVKHIGLMMGSYNPIHIGHLLIAIRSYETKIFDEIWLVISPANPHKEIKTLADEKHRLYMAQLALQNIDYPIYPCDIEFSLPKPSYTIHTLSALQQKFPNNKFSILLGADNMERLHEWKNIEEILYHHSIYIYNRSNAKTENLYANIKMLEMPLVDISSTEIRSRIKENLPIDYFVCDTVKEYIHKYHLYS